MTCINMHIIARELSEMGKPIPQARLCSPDNEATLKYCSLWQSAEQARDDTVYLVEAGQSIEGLDAKQRFAFVCLSSCTPPAGKMHDYLLLDPDWNLTDAFNAVQSVFVKYQEWESALQEAVSDGSSISELVKLSLPVFNNTILVHDGDFRIIAFASPPNTQFVDALYNQIVESQTFPKEFLEAFVRQSDFPATFEAEAPGYWFDETYKTISTYINIHLAANYLVRVSVETTNTVQYSGDLIKLSILAKYLRLAYAPSIHENKRFTIHLDSLMHDLATGVHVDEEDLTEQMRPYSWSYDDCYLCVKVELGEETQVEYRLRSVCERLRSLYRYSCAFILDNGVALVQNLTKIGQTEEDFLTALDTGLSDNNLRAGTSYSFGEIYSLDKMCAQADIALKHGTENGLRSVRTFESAILNYLVDNRERRLAPEYLCPKPLFLLLDYDRHRKTNLTDTLQAYLENKCSINRCCEVLFVHRSTLTYRIERVEALTGADLDDADTRLLYQVALRMLGKRPGALGPYAKACRIYRI